MTKFKAVMLVLLVAVVTACSVNDFLVMTKSVMTQNLPLPESPGTAAWSKEEMKCLTLTIYGEARDQPFHGQVAVGAVVVSRSLSPKWDKDLCKVVRQKGQFAGYWAALKGGIKEPAAWKQAEKAAWFATTGYPYLPPQYQRAFFFTLRSEKSDFHSKMEKIGYIKDHAFYSENRR